MIAEYLSGVKYTDINYSFIGYIISLVLVYKLLSLLKGTRGMQLVKGILIVIGLKIFFNFIGFKTMHIYLTSSYLGSTRDNDYIPTRITKSS